MLRLLIFARSDFLYYSLVADSFSRQESSVNRRHSSVRLPVPFDPPVLSRCVDVDSHNAALSHDCPSRHTHCPATNTRVLRQHDPSVVGRYPNATNDILWPLENHVAEYMCYLRNNTLVPLPRDRPGPVQELKSSWKLKFFINERLWLNIKIIRYI